MTEAGSAVAFSVKPTSIVTGMAGAGSAGAFSVKPTSIATGMAGAGSAHVGASATFSGKPTSKYDNGGGGGWDSQRVTTFPTKSITLTYTTPPTTQETQASTHHTSHPSIYHVDSKRGHVDPKHDIPSPTST